MAYQFEFRPYRRPFRFPLQTHHGTWRDREGIIIRLKDDTGRVGWGEIAPLPWFGSEDQATALAFCQAWPPAFSPEAIFGIPPSLPACQVGFETAWDALKPVNQALDQLPQLQPAQICSLLPTGERALEAWPPLWQAGYRTFKLKIGVSPLEQEQAQVIALRRSLPPEAKLRLDANGGLTEAEAPAWLALSDRLGIEFLEQPLPPAQFETLMSLSQQYQTPLALDESVATVEQLQACFAQGWRGLFVVKAAIAGSPRQLRQFGQTHPVRFVFSTVFETSVGRQAILRLAQGLQAADMALGFGVGHWFDDEWDTWTPEQLWQHLNSI
jgi:O-succinylbenzoate synthase